MSRTVQFKRYANTTLANIVGASGELIVDTTNQTLTVHDGVTPGGSRVATESFAISNGGVGGGSGTDNVARDSAQSAFIQANTASSNTIVLQGGLDTANANITLLFAVNDSQNNNIQSAFDQANSANTLAQSAYDKANTDAIDTTARSVANSASSNTIALQGGLNTANANIAYILAVDIAQNTSISAANSVAQGAFAAANTSSANTIQLQGGLNSANANISLLQGGLNTANANIAYILAVDLTQNTNITGATTLAQAAFDKANSANTLAQSAYDKANTGSGGSSSGYLPNAIIFANTAGYLSNSAALQFTAGSNTVTMQGPVNITNQAASTTNSTGALIVSGGVGVAENIYTGARVGYSSGGVSVAYTYYNSANNSLDTVFG